jgi:hypothetical protein
MKVLKFHFRSSLYQFILHIVFLQMLAEFNEEKIVLKLEQMQLFSHSRSAMIHDRQDGSLF